LESVSRTFFLSIKGLPVEMRDPVALGYLVARATDTIADATRAPIDLRLELLRAFSKMFKEGWEPIAGKRLARELGEGLKPGEKLLLEKAGELIGWYDQMPEFEQLELLRVWSRISHAQELDLTRFGNPANGGVVSLATTRDLDEYTYLIAGSVGEFWTRLAAKRCPDFSKVAPAEMEKRGVNFGKALQLINVLRDFPGDLKQGRCYLPAEELEQAGVDPAALAENPALARSVHARWLGIAREHMESAYAYTEAVQNRAIRLACSLPLAIGSRTLTILEKDEDAINRPVKITRNQVTGLVAKGIAASWLPFLLPKYLRG